MSLIDAITQKIKEAFYLLRSGKYFQFAKRLCANCLPTGLALLDQSYLMERRIPGPVAARTSGGLVVRRASPADLTKIIECSNNDTNIASPSLFQRFFRSGHACYLIEEGEKILGYSWVFFNSYCITYDGYQESRINLRLRPGSIFVGNIFVNPANRHQGLYSCMFNAIVNELFAARGVNEVLVNIKSVNSASLAVHEKLGFRRICTLNYLGFYGLPFLVAIPLRGRFRIYPGNPWKAIAWEEFCEPAPAPGADP